MLALENRIRLLNKKNYQKGLVAYWMSRDQRAEDNWALLFAAEQAKKMSQNLVVLFTLDLEYPGANRRHFDFMLRGLQEVETRLKDLGIPFILRKGKPVKILQELIKEYRIGLLITDFDPLHVKKQWKWELTTALDIPFLEVDTHNIVPCWVASDKEENGAFTLRVKIKRLLPQFLIPIPEIPEQKLKSVEYEPVNWDQLFLSIEAIGTVNPLVGFIAGSKSAHVKLNEFLNERLLKYNLDRNDPNGNAVSDLSPYLHFGQIAS